MILIRFPNPGSKRVALGRLAGRFGFQSWVTGEMLVPEDALPFLAMEGIAFSVEGPRLSGDQRQELRRRVAEDDADPKA